MIPVEKDIARFWARVVKTNHCWFWVGHRNAKGYGAIKIGRKNKRQNVAAHRFVWIITNGEIPSGTFVCHTCDIPNCVNPAHLFLGTHQDNMNDMKNKGYGFANKGAPGEKNFRAKLKESDVRKLLTDWKTREFSQRELGIKYGIGQTTVSCIVNRKNWRHVEIHE